MPRLRVNHSVMSATSGTKLPEVPTPISNPWIAVNCTRFCEKLAATKPSPRLTEPTSTGTITSKRSERLPISTPPSPNPIMVKVKGSEASPRAMANSACSGGSTTAMEYIPEPPTVVSASAIQRRVHAYGESAPCDVWRVLMRGRPAQREREQCRGHREEQQSG